MGGECAARFPCDAKRGLSVINHLLIYLIKQGPAACRHLSLVEWGWWCQVYSAPPLHWAAAGGAHIRMKGWSGGEGGEGGSERGRRERKKRTVIKCLCADLETKETERKVAEILSHSLYFIMSL